MNNSFEKLVNDIVSRLKPVTRIGEVKVFPRDCYGCKNHIHYDMSIDDITNICNVTGRRIDDCDMDFINCKCPEGRIKTEKLSWEV